MANLDVARKTLPLAAASWQSLDQKEHRAQGKIINNGASMLERASDEEALRILVAFYCIFEASERRY